MQAHEALPPVGGDERALTDAQVAVLRLAASGLSSGEIAARLGSSSETVRAQLLLAMRTLGADSKLEAISLAARAGRLDLAACTAPPASR
jgi:LuxR family transcriptional regulator, regulator of acetate metabolism